MHSSRIELGTASVSGVLVTNRLSRGPTRPGLISCLFFALISCFSLIVTADAQVPPIDFDRCQDEHGNFLAAITAATTRTVSTLATVTEARAKCAPPLFNDASSIEACQKEVDGISGELSSIITTVMPAMTASAWMTHVNLESMADIAAVNMIGARVGPLESEVVVDLMERLFAIWFEHRQALRLSRSQLNRRLSKAAEIASSPAMNVVGLANPVSSLNREVRTIIYGTYPIAPYTNFRECHQKSAGQIASLGGVTWALVRLAAGRIFGDGIPSTSSSPLPSDYIHGNYAYLEGPFAIDTRMTHYKVDLSKYPQLLKRSVFNGIYSSSSAAGILYETRRVGKTPALKGLEVEEITDELAVPTPFELPSGWSVCANQKGHGGDIKNASLESLEEMISIISDGVGGKCITLPIPIPWGYSGKSVDPIAFLTMPQPRNDLRPHSMSMGALDLMVSNSTPPNPSSIGKAFFGGNYKIMHSPANPSGSGFVTLELSYSDIYSNPNPGTVTCFRFQPDNGGVNGQWIAIRPKPPGC